MYTFYSNVEIEDKNIEENIILTKDTILWRGSQFIFEDMEKNNHPLTSFIRYLGFILSEIYERGFEIEQSKVLDEEKFQNSLKLNLNKNFIDLRNILKISKEKYYIYVII